MSIETVDIECVGIIERIGDSKIARMLGVKQPSVWEARTEKKIPKKWVDRILALEGLEVSISPAKTQ